MWESFVNVREGIKTVGVQMDPNGTQRYNFFLVEG